MDDHFSMTVPETTSAKGFARFVGGKCLKISRGEAWRDIKAYIIALPPRVDTLHLPAVSEAAEVELTANDLREIESAAAKIEVLGARYPERLEKMTGL